MKNAACATVFIAVRLVLQSAMRAHAMNTGSEEAKTAVMEAISALDKAAEKGVIHKNNAARRKGRLMKHLASLDLQPAKANEPQVEAKETPAKKSRKKSA